MNVMFSVLCAIIHVIFEFISLFVEAKTSETPFIEYVVTCYNSREKWMPRQARFQKQIEVSKEIDCNEIEIDQPGLFCKGRIGFKINFKFTSQSIETLMQLISNMSESKAGSRLTLIIDDCFKGIEPEKILQLVILANNKVNLMFQDKQLEQIE